MPSRKNDNTQKVIESKGTPKRQQVEPETSKVGKFRSLLILQNPEVCQYVTKDTKSWTMRKSSRRGGKVLQQ